ncbi:MAG TPA: two-component regulator propeller domain-containing protein [Patescibacteria group bacterium]|nr:two-component regulator propeller domain-containing protein [Patescibacteria group bacterium]
MDRATNRFLGLALLLWLVAAIPIHLLALDPKLELNEYAVEHYSTENGLPQSSVLAMVQTRDGYLWLGTYEGLARFDGLNFTVFDKSNTPQMESNGIKALAEDREGRLWVGTTAGLLRYSKGRFERFDNRQGLQSHFILCLFLDRSDTLWAGTTAGLYRWKKDRFQAFTTVQGLSSNYITSLADDGAGGIWIGTGRGLNHFHNGKIEIFDTGRGLPHSDIRALHLDRRGTLWIGSSGGGLFSFRNGRFERLKQQLSSDDIRAVYQDRHGIMWIGTNQEPLNRLKDGRVSVMGQRLAGLMSARVIMEDREGSLWVGSRDGLIQLKDEKFILYGSRNGLPVDPVRAVLEDRQGSIWVGTVGGGLVRFQDGEWKTYNQDQGLLSDHVWSIAQGADDSLWVGTYGGGLFRMPAGRKSGAFTRVRGVSSDIIRALLADSSGRIWVGTNGGGLDCIEEGRISNFNTAHGLPNNYIYALGEDKKGRIWVGAYNGGLAVLEQGRFRKFAAKNIADQPVWVIHTDRDGDLWVGTDHAGLLWIHDEQVVRFSSRDGLYSDQAFQILEDRRGRLWMNCNKGIYHVAKKDLLAYAAGKLPRIPCVSFGKSEGIKVTESSGPAQPAGCIDRLGRIWFPTIRGLTMFDPDRLRINRVEPPLVIEKVVINDRNLTTPGTVTAPPGKGNIEIDYTAISFLQVDKMQFAYRLEGFDPDWIQVGNRRSAFYTNLPPGSYTFRVIAGNGDGIWNRRGTAFAFKLQPYFHQTAWFRWFVALSSILLVAVMFFLALHRAKVRERKLENLVDERTVQLQRLARYDGLTDLANHRTFYEIFQKEWAVAGREKKLLSVIAVDIDFFKTYNDSLGHQEGDECLRKVAQAIRAHIKRPADLAARTGGDEFFLMLPGTGNDGALAMAESIRTAITRLAIPHPASPIAAVVTVSLGVATTIPAPGTVSSRFIARADHALYHSKRQGRNRSGGN